MNNFSIALIVACGVAVAVVGGVEIGFRTKGASILPWLKEHLAQASVALLAFFGVTWAVLAGRANRRKILDAEREQRNRAHELEEKRNELIFESDRIAIERERMQLRGVELQQTQVLTREAIDKMDHDELEAAWKAYVDEQGH